VRDVAVGHWLLHGVQPGEANLESSFSLDAILDSYEGLQGQLRKFRQATVPSSSASVVANQSSRVGHGLGNGYERYCMNGQGLEGTGSLGLGVTEPDALALAFAQAEASLSVYSVIRVKLVRLGLLPYYRFVEGPLAVVLAEMEHFGLRGKGIHIHFSPCVGTTCVKRGILILSWSCT
jgi:hypothetical protein